MSTTPEQQDQQQPPIPPPDEKEDGWIGFDLDGTLAYHDPDEFDPYIVGEPVPLMLQTAKWHLDHGDDIQIVTARVSPRPDYATEDVEEVRKAIEDWTEEHLGKRLKVRHDKDYKMRFLYDDRVRQVIPNTGITMGQLVASLRRALERAQTGVEFSPEVEEYLEDQGNG